MNLSYSDFIYFIFHFIIIIGTPYSYLYNPVNNLVLVSYDGRGRNLTFPTFKWDLKVIDIVTDLLFTLGKSFF